MSRHEDERGHRGGRHGGHHGGPGAGHRGGPFDPRTFAGNPLGFLNMFRRGTRARRGDIRSGILALLAEAPRNGYQIMQELEQRSRGMWRPSPGAVYPALQQLEDEGLIKAETGREGGGRVFTLTARGRAEATARATGEDAPWETVSEAAGDDIPEMFYLVKQLGAAALQVVGAGSAAQIGEARRILTEARRALYRLLADDDEAGEAPTAPKRPR